MEFETYLRFLAALVFVLAMIGLLAWLARRFGVGGKISASPGRRRLGIVEVSQLDGKRRLILVRRDRVEHLLLLGAGSEIVIETGIPTVDAPTDGEDVAAVDDQRPTMKRLAEGAARALAAATAKTKKREKT